MKWKTLIIFFLLALLLQPAWADFFKDVSRKDPAAYLALRRLLKTGVVKLPADKKFNGSKTIDLYQLAFIFDRLLAYSGKLPEVKAQPLTGFYSDIPADHYAYEAVSDLVKFGLFTVPGSKRFNGKAKINRYTFYAYFAAFLERLEGANFPIASTGAGFYDVSPDNPNYLYIQKLVGAGILKGRGRFYGERLVTRYEMAVFAARVLDHYLPVEQAETGPAAEEQSQAAQSYSDIPQDNYARTAVGELIEVGIISPGPPAGRAGRDRAFRGDELINRYMLVSFISRIIEKIVAGDQAQLPLASPALGYKDVPASSYAYRSIQKMIDLGVIPSGNRRELFYGDRWISRYQMVFFVFSAVENVMGDVISFKSAPATLGYRDVPQDHFVHKTIQQLVWLGVLEGGAEAKFDGDQLIDKYELAYFTVNLIKALFLKLEDVEVVIVDEKPDYGFHAYLSTDLVLVQNLTNEVYGDSTLDVSAGQTLSLYFNRSLNDMLLAFASLSASYSYGDATLASPYVNEVYLVADLSPLILQAGRTSYYQGYTPFGNSLYVDTSADLVLVNYDLPFVSLNTLAGKFVYFGQLDLDSKFGSISLQPNLPKDLSWLELLAGASLITDLPDPDFTQTLSTNVSQMYGGIKVNLFNMLTLSYERAQLEFTDPSVLSWIGYSAVDDLTAQQTAISYYSEDYGFSLSLGHQLIGDDYYLSQLIDQTNFFNTGQNTESYLLRSVFTSDPTQTISFDLAAISRDGESSLNKVAGYYSLEIIDSVYFNASVLKTMDKTIAMQDDLTVSSSFSVTF